MLVSNVREACYIAQKSGIMPNVVKLKEESRYDWGFDFVIVYGDDSNLLKELFELRFEYEHNEDIRKNFEKELDVDLLVYLKRLLNAKKH